MHDVVGDGGGVGELNMAEEAKTEEAAGAADGAPAAPSGIKKLMGSPLFPVIAAVVGGALGAGGMMMFGKKPPPPAPAAPAAAAHAPAAKAHGEEEPVPELPPAPEIGDEAEAHGEAKAGGEAEAAPAAAAHGEKAAEATAPEAAAEGEGGGAHGEGGAEGMSFKFEPFVINVFEKNSVHYLKLQVEVDLTSPAVGEEIKAKQPKFRDAAIFLVGDMTMREIVTAGGKVLLKEELLSAFNKMLKSGKITKMYFTEFTIQ